MATSGLLGCVLSFSGITGLGLLRKTSSPGDEIPWNLSHPFQQSYPQRDDPLKKALVGNVS